MSAFGDNDPRTEIYDTLKDLQQRFDLRNSRLVACALEAIHLFAEEAADARDRAENK